MTDYRREEAYRVRMSAAAKAQGRVYPEHRGNGDEQRYSAANYAMSFTKGLEHCKKTGLIVNKEDFEAFRRAIDEGFIDAFTSRVRSAPDKDRAWEAPTAGVVYELEGPDPQSVTMAPAPALGSDELAYEMAEVYELALLRDEPLTDLADGTSNSKVTNAVKRLNALEYTTAGFPGRPRTTQDGKVSAQTVFRGSSPQVDVGPYLSQFLLIGNDHREPGGRRVEDGYIQYGVLQVDQRGPVAKKKNFLTKWHDWLEAQNGVDLAKGQEADLFEDAAAVKRRFMTFPRDLATYVHYDALYEAYLNACLILLSMGTPSDPAFSQLSGQGDFFFNSLDTKSPHLAKYESHRRAAGGFALYGGPHILTLVTEVATRALKAVRFQKFNTHIRLRPEALAARIERANKIETKFPQIGTPFTDLAGDIEDTVEAVRKANASGEALLPMAFQEGSPMHPSYGAGHATVAGACVTILKAFFDTNAVFVRRCPEEDKKKFDKKDCKEEDKKDVFALYEKGDQAVQYVPDATGEKLVRQTGCTFLTLEGELNKLAANISIGRNMAGVHYYSDYYDSLRMGEKIAIGILEEQALCYPTDPFVLTVPTFDGDVVRIGTR